jgi:hypothetical protein
MNFSCFTGEPKAHEELLGKVVCRGVLRINYTRLLIFSSEEWFPKALKSVGRVSRAIYGA